MIRAVFPGSFDPPTNGHLNIIQRAAKMFSNVDVVIAVNIEKKSLLSIEERINYLKKMTENISNVRISSWNGLIVDFAKENNDEVLIRGIRNGLDFDYEFELAKVNKKLLDSIETVFLPTDSEFSICKSSTVKELVKYGADVSDMIPDFIRLELEKKLKN